MNTTNVPESFSITPCPPFETYFFDFKHDEIYLIYLDSIIALNCIIAVFSLTSNFLVMYTIVLSKPLHSPSNALIVGLSVSDFGVGMVSQPCFCVLRIAELQLNVDLFCQYARIFQASIWMLATVSFLTYTAITADRYMAVYLHLRYKVVVTNKKIAWILLVIWAFCTAVAVVRLTVPVSITRFIVTPVFIGFVIANMYFISKIATVIRRHSRQIHAQERSIQSNINMPRYKKTVNTMYYVIGVFVLCYLPFMISLFIQGIMNQVKYKTSRELFSMQLLASTFIMFNGVLNPIIYYWRIKELRNGTARLLKKLWVFDKITQVQSLEPEGRLSLRYPGDLEVPAEPKVWLTENNLTLNE